MGKDVVYIRVSSTDQNTARQVDALKEIKGKRFIDKASGGSTNRPALEKMLEYIREVGEGESGDTINVYSIDRLARNIMDLNRLVKEIVAKGCIITFHKENLTFGNGDNAAMSELLLNILGSFAQFERSMIKERQMEGIAAAKKKGKHLGRPSKLSEQQKQEIIEKRSAGATPSALAKEYGVSRALVYMVTGEIKRGAESSVG